jgi:hypothetical protein
MRLPTLNTVGRVGLIVGVLALAAPLLWKKLWPTPKGTIDAPRAGTTLAGCYVAQGRVLPSTIWRPLWLISAESGRGWRPVAKLDPSYGTWQQRICAGDLTATHSRLALVVVDRSLDAEFERRNLHAENDDVIPEWLKPNHAAEQQGGRGRRHGRGFSPIPAGATPLASVEVVVAGEFSELFPMR